MTTHDGGPVAMDLRRSLEKDGFGCDRVSGAQQAMLVCYRTQRGPVPTLQRVRAMLVEHGVANISASVRADPGWKGIPGSADADLRQTTGALFAEVTRPAWAHLSKEDITKLGVVLHKATGSGEKTRFDLTEAFGSVRIARSGGTLLFSPSATSSASSGSVIDPGLGYLTPKELETAAESAGMRCERGPEVSNCRAGEIRLRIVFPATRGSGDQRITEVSLSGPAAGSGRPAPSLVRAARAVAGKAGDKFGDGKFTRSWAGRCFQTTSRQTVIADAEATCTPTMAGSAKQPLPKRYTFTLADLDDTGD